MRPSRESAHRPSSCATLRRTRSSRPPLPTTAPPGRRGSCPSRSSGPPEAIASGSARRSWTPAGIPSPPSAAPSRPGPPRSGTPRGPRSSREIEWLLAAGITQGCGAEKFCPGEVGDRASRWRASWLVRCCCRPATSTTSGTTRPARSRTTSTAWPHAGVTTGCAHALFCPTGLVTARPDGQPSSPAHSTCRPPAPTSSSTTTGPPTRTTSTDSPRPGSSPAAAT